MPGAGFWGGVKPPPGVQLNRDGPMAHKLLEFWPFVERYGGLAYGAAKGHNGTFTNGAIWASSPNGPVLSTNGGASGSYLEAVGHSDFDTPDVGTVAFRIKIRSGTRAALFSRASGSSSVSGMTIYVDDTSHLGVSLKQNNATGVYDQSGGSSIADSLWHNIAVVYYRGTTGINKVYMDGSVVVSGVCTGAWAFTATDPVRVGRSVDTFWAGVNADYAYVAWWGRELALPELAHFFAQPGEMFAPPVWRRYFVAPASGGTTYTQTVSATQAQAAALVKQANLVRTSMQSQSAVLQKQPSIVRSATQAQAATHSKQVNLTRSDTQAQSASITSLKVLIRVVSATQAQAAALVKTVQAIRSATQAQAASTSNRTSLTRSAAQAQSVAVQKQPNLTRSATQAQSASRTTVKVLSRVVSATQVQAATLAKSIALSRSVNQPQSATHAKAVSLARSLTQGQSAAVSKVAQLVRLVNQAQAAVVAALKGGVVTPGRHTVSDSALFVHTVTDAALIVHSVSDLVPVG